MTLPSANPDDAPIIKLQEENRELRSRLLLSEKQLSNAVRLLLEAGFSVQLLARPGEAQLNLTAAEQ